MPSGSGKLRNLYPLSYYPGSFYIGLGKEETMGSGLHFSQFWHNVKSEDLTPICAFEWDIRTYSLAENNDLAPDGFVYIEGSWVCTSNTCPQRT